MSSLLLCIFFVFSILAVPQKALADAVTLAWDASTTNQDGSPLTNLRDYKLYLGTSSGNYPTTITGITTLNHTFPNLTAGTYYARVSAFNTSNLESSPSAELQFTVAAAPATPTPTRASTNTFTPTRTNPPVATSTTTRTPTRTPTRTVTFTRTPVIQSTATTVPTITFTPRSSPSITSTPSATITQTATRTMSVPTAIPTNTLTPVVTATPQSVGALQGTILDTSAEPVSGVIVYASGLNPAMTITNQDGFFIFKNAVIGQSYLLTPSRNSWLFEPSSLTITAGESEALFIGEANKLPARCKQNDLTKQLMAIHTNIGKLGNIGAKIAIQETMQTKSALKAKKAADSALSKLLKSGMALPAIQLDCSKVLTCAQVSLVKPLSKFSKNLDSFNTQVISLSKLYNELNPENLTVANRYAKNIDSIKRKLKAALKALPSSTYQCADI